MRLGMAQNLGPFTQRAVAGDFIVFDRLGGGDQAGVQCDTGGLFDDAVGFLDQAINRITFDAGRFFADRGEDFVKDDDLLFCLGQMGLNQRLEFGIPSGFCHIRQGLGQRGFGIIDILKGVVESFCKGFHGSVLWFAGTAGSKGCCRTSPDFRGRMSGQQLHCCPP